VSANTRATAICRVLEEDPDLAEAIDPAQRDQAIRECIARAVEVPSGPWQARSGALDARSIGLLVLRGTLIRRVGVDGRFGAELLGERDVLRPWQEEEGPAILALTSGWQVIEPVRMAILDEQFARRASRYPELTAVFVERTLARTRNLAVKMAIVHHPRVDVRVHMVLWHLAARWGRVTDRGMSLPLRLTHAVLADLTAAQRQSVSKALSELAKRGLVESVGDGWMLWGAPPAEIFKLREGARTPAANARRLEA
jgi:hypothetical protein